ncbi:hypothetical protein EVAR_50587_1 [Eumeta japonica]|uniref:Uncharacterized protein n=1 Tax=Eumeta variegata TaxID=151549 RepID=A0A4C1YAH6_EUMVA|nr:hypothetical protein EVAR_50587_1 [Eumeta japonica]
MNKPITTKIGLCGGGEREAVRPPSTALTVRSQLSNVRLPPMALHPEYFSGSRVRAQYRCLSEAPSIIQPGAGHTRRATTSRPICDYSYRFESCFS